MENILQVQSLGHLQGATLEGGRPLSPFATIQNGETLRAQVIDANGGKLTLSLPDGTHLSAAMQAGQTIEVQDTLELQLTSGDANMARLRLLSINEQPVTAELPSLDFDLMQLDMPASQSNLAALSLFRNLELPLSTSALARYSQLMQAFPDMPIEQAAVFASSSVPLTGENVASFQQFLQSPIQLTAFASAMRAAAGISTQDAALSSSPAALPVSAPSQGIPLSTAPAAVVFDSPVQDVSVSAAAVSAGMTASGADAPVTVSSAFTGENVPTAPLAAAPMFEAAGAADALPERAAEQTAGNPLVALSPSAAPLSENSVLTRPLAGGAPTFQSDAVEAALSSIFPKLLPEESRSLSRALQKIVPQLASRVASLSQSADSSSSSPSAKQAGQVGNQFVQQLQFGNEMGSLYYTQIPFAYRGKESSADLYVLKRRGKESGVDPDNATIALCLETQNMGRVESLVEVKQQELGFCFRVENQAVKSFMLSELDALSSLSFPAQYRYRGSTVRLIESPITPLNAAKALRDTFDIHESSGIDISV